jgi:predicted nuclease with TOPRIM domain
MVDIQEIFSRMQENKKKQKDLRTLYKDALDSSLEYKEVVDKLKALREKKKQIEETTKQQFTSEFNQLDAYKTDLESDLVLLSDAALSMMMKGEQVEVQDEYHNTYDPIFVVKFKKAN